MHRWPATIMFCGLILKYRNDPKFLDSQVWANSVSLFAILSVSYCMVKSY